MGVFEHFPYANFQELNLDWLLKKMRELVQSHHRVEWRMIGGNPVKRHYDKFCRRYGGNVVKLHEVVKSPSGKYVDEYLYEIVNTDKH